MVGSFYLLDAQPAMAGPHWPMHFSVGRRVARNICRRRFRDRQRTATAANAEPRASGKSEVFCADKEPDLSGLPAGLPDQRFSAALRLKLAANKPVEAGPAIVSPLLTQVTPRGNRSISKGWIENARTPTKYWRQASSSRSSLVISLYWERTHDFDSHIIIVVCRP